MMKNNPPPPNLCCLAQACAAMEGAAVWELFERGLAVCHVAHFVSFYIQIVGLIGQGGMQPVKETLRSIRARWSPGITAPPPNPSSWRLPAHTTAQSSCINPQQAGATLSIWRCIGIRLYFGSLPLMRPWRLCVPSERSHRPSSSCFLRSTHCGGSQPSAGALTHSAHHRHCLGHHQY